MVVITPQSESTTPPYQLTAQRAPNFAEVEANAATAPVIAKAAFFPYLEEMIDKFHGSPLSSLFGMSTKGNLPPGQNGLSGIDIGFTSVTKQSTTNYQFSTWQTKKLFSNRVLNATTTAAGSAGGAITAAFNIDLGGYPITKGDMVEMVDSTGQVITYICQDIGTTTSNIQSGVILQPLDGTITSATVLTSSYVMNRGRQSNNVIIGAGQYSESTQFSRTHTLSSYNSIKRDVFNKTNILQKMYFRIPNTQNDPFLPGLSSNSPNQNQQMWWSDRYRTMMMDELVTIHEGWLFSQSPDNPNPAVYGPTAGGGFTVPYNGLVPQVETGGYDIEYTPGALVLSDFDRIYQQYRDDSLGGQIFNVSGGNTFLDEAELALSQGVAVQTLLQVEQQTSVQAPREQYGFTRIKGWTRYINGKTGGNFTLTEMRPFSDPQYKMVYGGSAIIVPTGLQKVVVEGVNVTSPAIILAYNGDEGSSFFENRSGGEYSGKFGMMPFVETFIHCHPSLKDKIFLGSTEASNVEGSIQDTFTGNLTVTTRDCLPIIGCVEATGFIRPV